jgi:hypothetical protein
MELSNMIVAVPLASAQTFLFLFLGFGVAVTK